MTTAPIICRHCSRSFTTRGIARHMRCCKKAPVVTNYTYCLVNDDIFRCILGYLSNQTLAKLQTITGDQYSQYDARLIPYACRRCENDRPAIRNGLCTRCHSRKISYKSHIIKTEAKDLYRIKNFAGIPCETRRRCIFYARTDLDIHMLKLHGSNREWLKAIASRDARCRALQATRERKEKEIEAYLKTLPIGFQKYIAPYHFPRKKSILKEMADRFVALDESLVSRGLKITTSSIHCINYVFMGEDILESVVDDIEEDDFLGQYTDYLEIAHSTVNQFKSMQNHRLARADYNFILRLCKEITKRMICVHYLQVGHDYSLPQKWEAFRHRLDNVLAAGLTPERGAARDYIYDNIGTVEDLIPYND